MEDEYAAECTHSPNYRDLGIRPIFERDAWREHAAATRDFRAAYERIGAAMLSADRGRHIDGLGL